MTQNDSAWLNDYFAGCARDSTPDLARAMVRILYAPASRDPEFSNRCASVLSDAELRHSEGFVTPDLKVHFKQRRAFRRYCGAVALGCTSNLSSINFDATEKGRPYLRELPGCWFSFSSCRLGFLGAWSSTHAIGVDIVDPTRDVEAPELARYFFSRAEAAAVNGAGAPARTSAFFQLWTLKEAALKSIGEGLPFGLDAFQFGLYPSIRIVDAPRAYGGPERFCAYAIEKAGSCAALAIRSDG
jgi:phosphopantetheinyl transferase